jgi:hypothetical protein
LGVGLLGLQLIWLTAGCSLTRHYGDARYQRSTWLGRNFSIGVPTDSFWLAEFSVAKPARFEFSVRNLPFPILPHFVEIHSHQEAHNAPWRSLQLDVTIHSLSGDLIASQHVVMERYPAGHWKNTVQIKFDEATLKRARLLTSYRVTVAVTHPSTVTEDRARLSARLIGHPAYPNQAIMSFPHD